MKRKFISILLVLVLVLSFSLVTAVPVAAQTTLNVIPFTLSSTGGDAAATWSTTQAHTGSYSAHLDSGTTTAGDEGRIVIDMPSGTTLSDLTSISWWVYAASGYPPHLDITLDCDGDSVVDPEDMLTAEMNLNCVGAPKSIATLTSEISYNTGWVQTFELTSADGFGAITDSTTFWVTKMGSGDLNAPSGTLAQWKAGTVANDPESEMTTPVITGSAPVVKLEIEVDNWVVNSDSYVDDVTINGVVWYGLIQDAVDSAVASDIIVMAAGTYTGDISIPAGKDNLELKPATGAAVTIKGVLTEPDTSFPLAVPNIDILSAGVKIHGFTIEGPDAVASEYASGMLIGAANVEIYDNDFKVTAGRATWAGPVSTGIITYRKTAIPTVDISGLNIHDNTFTNHGTGAAGFDAIFINLDTGTTTATIADNEFTGNVARAISAERSNMVISGNSIVTNLAPYTASVGGYQGMFIGCFAVDSVYPAQSDVSVTGNTVKGATSSEGFAQGIRVGHTSQTSLTNITVLRNTVQDCDEGITVRADATGVTVNYNEITGNTVGVQNDDTGVELDAQYNWWGDVAGPDIATNPYDSVTSGDVVSADVDYLPWMIHDTLVAGWNIWSTPIAAATGLAGEPDTNTVEEALDFWTADSTKVIDAYYFNSATQAWVVPTSLTPLQAVYLNLSDAATIDVCVSDSNYAPPGRTMHLGWNLVGTADWDDDKLVHFALEAAFWGTGQTDLIGYQYVISPSIHQTAWTFVRNGTATGKYFVPTEGYWVYMVNQGILNGFTYTPIVEVP